MTARAAFALLLLASPLLIAQTQNAPPANMPSKTQSPEAVHHSALVIDTHADTPQRFLDEHFDLADPLNGGNLNLDSIHKGNLGAEFFSIWVEPKLYKGQYARRTLELIDSVKQQVARHPDQIQFVTSPEGIEEAHRNHKFAALMGIEGGHSIENSLALLRQYYALGVRYMTLTWSNSNDWADSSGDIDDTSIPHTKEGLTEFGKDVVYEMNRLGMMVDISHVSDATFYRTLRISRAPVIASHSGARALCNAPRNMTDDMIRAVATYGGGPNSKGGVVQVNFFSGFVSQAYWDALKAQKPEVKKAIAEAKDKAKAEGREFKSADEDKIHAQLHRSHSPSSALHAHRSHRPHRQGGRCRPCWPRLRLRRRQRPAPRGPRLTRRSAQRSPRPSWLVATRPRTAARSSAATSSASFAKLRWYRSSSKQKLVPGSPTNSRSINQQNSGPCNTRAPYLLNRWPSQPPRLGTILSLRSIPTLGDHPMRFTPRLAAASATAFFMLVPAFSIAQDKKDDKKDDKAAAQTEKDKAVEKAIYADSTTQGTVEVAGQNIAYTAVVGVLTVASTNSDDAQLGLDGKPLPGSELALEEPKEPKDAIPTARISYVAYFKKDAKAEDRPITFFYNGGPGQPRFGFIWAHSAPSM